MKRIARFLFMLVLAALAIGILFSCTPPKGEQGKTLIIFWDFPRLPAVRKWLEEAIVRYEELNPDVDIQYTCLSWSKGGERLAISAFAYRPPDVAGAVLDPKYVQAGLLAPLDKYLNEPMPGDPSGRTFKEDIHPNILKACQWQGVTYSFPWYKEGMVMVCNTDIFKERGVSLPENGSWTWDEFTGKMKQLTFDRDGDGKTDVYGVGFNTGYEKWEAYPFILGEGMKILDDSGHKILVDSEETRRGLRRLLDMEFNLGISFPGAGGITDSTTWAAFSGDQRRLAVTCQGLWAINAARVQNQRREESLRDNPGLAVPPPLNIAVVQYPTMPGRPHVMGSYGVGSYCVFNRPLEPERTEAAARFARWLTLETGQEINRLQGVLPSRISYKDIFSDDPLFAYIADTIPDAISAPVHPAWRNVDQVISEQLQLVLLRQVPDEKGTVMNSSKSGPLNESDMRAVDVAVRIMAQKAQKILDDYWIARGENAE